MYRKVKRGLVASLNTSSCTRAEKMIIICDLKLWISCRGRVLKSRQIWYPHWLGCQNQIHFCQHSFGIVFKTPFDIFAKKKMKNSFALWNYDCLNLRIQLAVVAFVISRNQSSLKVVSDCEVSDNHLVLKWLYRSSKGPWQCIFNIRTLWLKQLLC